MVPGVFKTVMPFFKAKPERGRICASKPFSKAMAMPVLINLISPDFIIISSSIEAVRSMPALPVVSYFGKVNSRKFSSFFIFKMVIWRFLKLINFKLINLQTLSKINRNISKFII